MSRYFIYLSYNGTAYHGWQKQPNGVSVQQCITDALCIILREEVSIVGAGRTDTGVHAQMMVAHFDTTQKVEGTLLTERLNKLLPYDIAVHKIIPVKADAHARFSALSRTYQYYITTCKDAFGKNAKAAIYYPLDFELMNEAAALLLQYTDFTSFSKLHSDAKTNICHITQAHWKQLSEHEWVFTITADRFLRNMVRAIVGTLIDVGRGKVSIEHFKNIITQKDRCSAGSSAPACGLYLQDIVYPGDIAEVDSSNPSK